MEPVDVVFGGLMGLVVGWALTYLTMVRPLVYRLLDMKRQGFVSYPKVLPPPKYDHPEPRED